MPMEIRPLTDAELLAHACKGGPTTEPATIARSWGIRAVRKALAVEQRLTTALGVPPEDQHRRDRRERIERMRTADDGFAAAYRTAPDAHRRIEDVELGVDASSVHRGGV